MTVSTTLRPNGSAVVVGSATIGGGAASHHAAASDNSDATYTRMNGGVSAVRVTWDFGTVSIPAGARVLSVTPRIRSTAPSTIYGNWRMQIIINGNAQTAAPFAGGAGSFVTTTAQASDVNHYGEFVQADIDALQLSIYGYGSNQFDVAELYLDVIYDEAPVVSSVAVSSANTSTPEITWAFADPEGEPVNHSQVNIFTAAQYGIGGFDPATSPATENGLRSSFTNYFVATPLTNTVTYRAYVRSATTEDPYWSAWSYVQWTVSFTPAVAPTMAAVGDNANRRIAVTLTGHETTPGYITSQRLELQRSDDGGTTWIDLPRIWDGSAMVDGADLDVSDVTQVGTFYDYEAPRTSSVRYRVRERATASGQTIYSAWSATTTPSPVLTLGRHWDFKSTTDASKNVIAYMGGDVVSWESTERQVAHEPLGRQYPVVVSDVIGADSTMLDLSFLDDASYNAFETLRGMQETILVQSPYGDHRYCRFGPKRRDSHPANPSGVRKHTVTIGLTVVDRPV